jgi:hypothetical protein
METVSAPPLASKDKEPWPRCADRRAQLRNLERGTVDRLETLTSDLAPAMGQGFCGAWLFTLPAKEQKH